MTGDDVYTARYVERENDAVNYVDAHGSEQPAIKLYAEISGDMHTLSEDIASWWVVKNDVTINERVVIDGDINLILCDGAALTVPKGVTVNSGNSLTVWQQNAGTGKLTAFPATLYYSEADSVETNNAGIGGAGSSDSGEITFNGGEIMALGGTNRSAVGGTGGVTVNNGKVTAVGGDSGAGIGGGKAMNGTVSINGGTVRAIGGTGGAGIGGGATAYGMVTISGGTVEAEGKSGSAGIGCGSNCSSEEGFVTISGGNVSATGGIGQSDPEKDCAVTLTWTDGRRDGMSVTSDGYCGTVTFEKMFKKETSDPDDFEVYIGTIADNSVLAGITLTPADETSWLVLQYLINNAENGGTVTLNGAEYAAVDSDAALVIPEGKELTLDLNGSTISRSLEAAETDGNVINNNGTLTIKDSSADKSGKITGGHNRGVGGAIVNNGTLTIESGEISGNTAQRGGGIYNASEATLTLNGGSVRNNTTETGGAGGGVLNDGTMTVSGGSVSENATGSYGTGGGVSNSGRLILSGGEIKNNTCGSSGGGIYSSGTVEMSGSPVVTGNKNGTGNTNNTELGGKLLTVTGKLSETALVGVGASIGRAFTQGLSGNGTAKNFSSDLASSLVRTNSGGEAMIVSAYTVTVISEGSGATSVDAENNLAVAGDIITVTAKPANGFYVESIYYEEKSNRANRESGTIYTGSAENAGQTVSAQFMMPRGKVEVTVKYAPAPVQIIGDANLDGVVNVKDVTAIRRHIAEFELLTGAAFLAADVNGDGVVDITDATLLQEYLADFDVTLGRLEARY